MSRLLKMINSHLRVKIGYSLQLCIIIVKF